MTGVEASTLSRQMELHLRRNEFDTCEELLVSARKNTMQRLRTCGKTAIAELHLDLRYVNRLEKEGYIYVEDLTGVDVTKLHIKHFGISGKLAVQSALERHRRQKNGEVVE